MKCVGRPIRGSLRLIGTVVPAMLLLLLLPCTAALAADSARSIFVKSKCDGKVSSHLVSLFENEIRASAEHRLVPSLEDEGRMGAVTEVFMTCTERADVVSVGSVYGAARCSAPGACEALVDGYSLNVALCDSRQVADCARTLVRALDLYLASSRGQQLKSW